MKTIYISREINDNDSLIITNQCLSQIFQVIKENYAEIIITAKCLNGLRIETDNICDIINYENMNYNKILSISCRACNRKEKLFIKTNNLDIEISIPSFSSLNLKSKTVSINLESESERDIQYISEKIVNYILSCRPWYSEFSKINFLDVGFILFIYLVFLSIVILLHFFQDTYISLNFLFMIIDFLGFVAYGLFILCIPPLSILKRLREFNNYIFPKIFFLVGQQEEEYKKIEQVRSLIFVVIILAFIIGLAVNWVSMKIF